MSVFTPKELAILQPLSTPQKIQDFLGTLKINFEENGDTCMSPRRTLEEGRAHCMEGAMLAAVVLRLHGHPPLVMDFTTTPDDEDHVVALFRYKGRWGALSKTNHAILRYRDPIYRTIRELAFSYFHEYFDFETGKKTLRSYSAPVNLSRFDKKGWMTSPKDVWYIPNFLARIPHISFIPRGHLRIIRPADPIEIRMGRIVEWRKAPGRGSVH